MNTEKVEIKDEVIKNILPFLLRGVLHGVYGKAGSGKTTLCLHLVKEFLHKNKGVVYIDTENGFFIERYIDIGGKDNLDMLFIRKALDMKDLRNALEESKKIIKEGKADLLVVDSLSTPYRVEIKDHNNIWDINRIMGRTIHEIKKIALHNNIPVVATHQVYVDFDTGEVEVVGRDLIKYDFKVMIYVESLRGNKRLLKLVRHPFLESREIEAYIKKEGFKKKGFI